MKEAWVGKYLEQPFRVIVNGVTGRIVHAEGAPIWAKGLRIRQFKREIWGSTNGKVEREIEDEVADVPPETGYSVEDVVPDEGRVVEIPQEAEASREKKPRTKQPSRDVLIHPGMNLKKALRAARRLGCMVHTVRRSGEVRVAHPAVKKRINANNRKKDAPRSLTAFLTQLQEFARRRHNARRT